MSNLILKWLAVLGLGPPDPPVAPTTRPPANETVSDAWDRGARLRPLQLSDISLEFQAKLLDVCKADSNVAALWLVAWMVSNDAAPELLASLRLDRPDQHAIRDFVDRADALQGPSFVVTIADGNPTAKPFYLRGSHAG